MKKISLVTDDYRIPIDLHNALKSELEKRDFKVEEYRCDTAAKGGPIWYPGGFAIFIAKFFVGVFLADEVMAQLTKLLGSAEFKKHESTLYISPDNKFYKGKISVTFSFRSCDRKRLKEAMEAIPDSQKELESILTSDFLKTYNQPKDIAMRYNHSLKKWVIKHFDIDTNIYFNETTGKYSPKSPPVGFIHKIFDRVMKPFK